MAQPISYLDQNRSVGINSFGQYFCTINYSATLAASTDTTLIVPGGSPVGGLPSYSFNKFVAVISVLQKSATATSVWMALNTAASAPAGASFGLTDSELITVTTAKLCKFTDVLHFFTTGSSVDISVSFYALQA